MNLNCSVFTLFFLLIFLFFCNCTENEDKLINEFVAQIPGGYSEAVSVARQLGFILMHKMIGFDDLFVFKHKKKGNDVPKFFQHRIKRSTKVNFVEQQIVRRRVKRSSIATSRSSFFTDPLYNKQWYLIRSQDQPNEVDMNVIEAWQLGYSGKGVVVTILDDGIDYRHPDLKDNYDPKASYDINGRDNDPLPNYHFLDNRHGTRCAGEVAAKGNNSQCGVGIAFNSRIGAVRMLDGEVTDRVEAEALSFNQQHIDIYSGSWGPEDNGQKVEGPARLAKAAFENGVKKGRNGLGNIYVWASGNGGNKADSCACDGYASSIYTLSVSSVSEMNAKPWYLESCASTLISTYSSGSIDEKQIISTDLNGQCALDHTGTSASAPLAAGIIALVLEANRNLTWRDVQYITVVTANTKPFVDANFIVNGANRKVSNLYGFGLMDAGKMVRLGRVWQTLPPQHVCKSTAQVVNRDLNGQFVETVFLQTDGCSAGNVVNYLEHVLLYVNIEYQRRGDLQIHLISPSGTRSEILQYRPHDYHRGNATFDKWPLMSVQFWGESSAGKWSLEIRNRRRKRATVTGKLISFTLEMYGTEKWPIHLRPSVENWFQQFERFVIYEGDLDIQVQNAYPRELTNNSSASERQNIKCHAECSDNKCNAWGTQQCLACKHYKTITGVCVDRCPSGTYLNSSSFICEPCHFSCDECIGASQFNCSRCHIGDSFTTSNGQCSMSVNNCSQRFYKDNSSCVKCQENCSICTSQSQCSRCNDGFVLTLNFQCKSACDLGTYVDFRGRCRACHKDCLQCVNGNVIECTKCDHQSFMLPIYDNHLYGKCIANCQPSHFTNYTTRSCFRCNENCKTCSGPSAHSCIDCIPPLIMSKVPSRCIDPASVNCKPDEFKSANGTCVKCPVTCQTCTDTRCTSCSKAARFIHNNSCVETCPKEHFSVSKDNICLPCKSFCDPCRRNETLSECNQCYNVSTSCTNRCKARHYWNNINRTCESCNPLCSVCNGGTIKDCLKCSHGNNVVSSAGGCYEKCSDGERVYDADNIQVCISCHPSCANSTCHSETGECLHCPTGHQKTSDGRCERVITCPMQFFWEVRDKWCKSCNASCRSCASDGVCDSCHRDHCLHPVYGTCHTCCSPFKSGNNCFKCKAGREICDLSDLDKEPPNIALYRLWLTTFCYVIVVCLLLFVLIMVLLYSKEIIEFVRISTRNWKPRSVKYTMLSVENDSADDDVDESTTLFQKSERSSRLLSTISGPINNGHSDAYHYQHINNKDEAT